MFRTLPCTYLYLQALTQLHMLGALDGFGEITDLGLKMSRLPLDPPLSRMLLESLERHVRILVCCTYAVWHSHFFFVYVCYKNVVRNIISLLILKILYYFFPFFRSKLWPNKKCHVTYITILYLQWRRLYRRGGSRSGYDDVWNTVDTTETSTYVRTSTYTSTYART